MCVAKEVACELTLEGDLLVLCKATLEVQSGNEDGGYQGGNDTYDQGCCESLDTTCSEYGQNDTYDDGRDITVEDCGVSVAVTILDSKAKLLSAAEFLLDSLIDDDVGVHRHTQGQNQTGDTRKCQNRSDGDKCSNQEDNVADQCDAGCNTGSSVEEQHVQQYKNERDQEREHTGVDGFLTEGRSNYLLLKNCCRCRKLTGLEHVGKVCGLFEREFSGDFTSTSFNWLVYVRIGINHSVQDNGYASADVVCGDSCPGSCTIRVHCHAYGRITALLPVGDACIGDAASVQRSLSVSLGVLDGNEFKVSLCIVRWFYTPHRNQVSRKDGLYLRHAQIFVNHCGILVVYNSQTSTSLIRAWTKNGKKRMALCQSGLVCEGISRTDFLLYGLCQSTLNLF